MEIRPGLEIIEEIEGSGSEVSRHNYYRIRLRLWLNRGDPVCWSAPWGVGNRAELSDDGAVLTTDVRLDREQLFNGLFYGVLGMHIGGKRKLRIAPHLAYGEAGLPCVIPENALLTAEIEILGEVISR